jgi:biopolymer transport protein ExbD
MHKKKKAEEMGVNLGIIITPMLDMAFQVLAFFIMTYHPSALEGHFDIKMLPPEKVAAKGKEDTSKDPPIDMPPELTDVLLVSVKAVGKGQSEGTRAEGDPSRIELKRPEDTNPEIVSDLNTEAVRKLTPELKDFLEDVPMNPKLKEQLKGMYNIALFQEGLDKLSGELKKFLEDPSHTKANIKISPDPDLKQKYTLGLYDACKLAGFQNIQFVAPAIELKKD